jgi:signal transduction histidine kinase
MLENLPTHFDDPEFREDALRGLGSAVRRITEFIDRLGSLRRKMEMRPEKADLNQLVIAALEGIGTSPELELVSDLETCKPVLADREQIQSVITNLLINAKDAVNGRGRIRVSTSEENDRVVLSVEDNGCGMTPEFLSESLFRPFHTTKKKGLGIGMFQSKMIVEAHGGSMVARSAPQHGTTFVVTLPRKHSFQ